MVSKQVCEKVFRIIERLQKESPRKAVTEKQVHTKIELSLRHVRRAFRKLREDRKIIRSGRGQYWLQEYLERTLEYLKRELELEKEFWGAVDKLRIQKIAELEHELDVQYQHYEEMLEHREILEELPPVTKGEILRAKRTLSKRK